MATHGSDEHEPGAVNAGALALVLGRGGSKGLSGKNVAVVGGKPCVAWTIEAALAAAGVGRVAVSTDDAGIARVAAGYGVEVVDRPAELAGDTARVDDAARHAVREIESRHGVMGNDAAVVVLYANVPVRPEGLIDRALAVLEREGADSVQSYAGVGKYHPWWMVRVDEGTGEVRPWEGDVLNHGVYRRQDLPRAYVPDGGVIAVRRGALMLEASGAGDGPHAFFGRPERRRGVVTGEGEVVDIDSAADLIGAETVLRARAGDGKGVS